MPELLQSGPAVPTGPGERRFTPGQRLSIRLISTFGTLAVFLIGLTLRWKIETESGEPLDMDAPAIYCFWHQCIFSLAWRYRNLGMAVMTSRSFDGEYIAQIIENLGYQAVRGSSSRGAVSALLAMHNVIRCGFAAIFTIDGPRGPMHVAKPGPILLAKNTQVPIVCAHVALERKWVFKTWDAMMIPQPFTRALARVAQPIPVSRGAIGEEMERLHKEMQQSLDRVTAYAEGYFLKSE